MQNYIVDTVALRVLMAEKGYKTLLQNKASQDRANKKLQGASVTVASCNFFDGHFVADNRATK